MEETQAVQAELMKQLGSAVEVRVQRARRIFVTVPYDKFMPLFDQAVGPMGFTILCTITGLDLGEQLGVIYHLSRPSGVTLNICTAVPKDKPVVQTIAHVFPAADLYERELVDLLGFNVVGLPAGHRYPLPDGWPAGQFPLRKEWTADKLPPTFEVTIDGKE